MNVTQELESVLRSAEVAVHRGTDAEEFGRLLYDDDVVVIGEGWTAATRGLPALLPIVATVLKEWGPSPTLKFTLVDPIVTSATVATAFIDVSVTPSNPSEPGQQYRALYSWTRGVKGWRVILEMFGSGSF